jgi:hypothetical protein
VVGVLNSHAKRHWRNQPAPDRVEIDHDSLWRIRHSTSNASHASHLLSMYAVRQSEHMRDSGRTCSLVAWTAWRSIECVSDWTLDLDALELEPGIPPSPRLALWPQCWQRGEWQTSRVVQMCEGEHIIRAQPAYLANRATPLSRKVPVCGHWPPPSTPFFQSQVNHSYARVCATRLHAVWCC